MAADDRLPVACFGKLPFHREFLRIGLGSLAATWVVRWIDGAHAALGKDRAGDGARTVRFAVRGPAGGLIAGVVRQSTDGLRRHPVVLFVDTGEVAKAGVHLLPVGLVEVWDTLCRYLDAPLSSSEDLSAALAPGVPRLDLALAEAAYRDALARAQPGGPWEALTGTSGDQARHFALNLLAIGRAQREAATPAEGVSVSVPLGGDDRELRAAIWVELLHIASGAMPPAALALVDDPASLFAYYRPVEGGDLAVMLGAPGTSIDDLSDVWQAMPPEDAALAAALNSVGAARPGTLAEVLAWVRSVASA